jgi:hypothetical protein
VTAAARGAAAMMLVLLAVGCEPGSAGPTAGEAAGAIMIERAAPTEQVVFGQPFLLRVERSWRRGLQAAPSDERALLPLQAELLEVELLPGDGIEREVRRYRAQAFALGQVSTGTPRLQLVAVGGGSPVRIEGPALQLDVASSLPAGDPGAIEQPAVLADLPRAARWPLWALGAVPLLLLALAFRRGRRALPPPAAALEPRQDRLPELRATLAALDPEQGMDREFAERLASALRDLAAESLQRRADVRTSEELAADLLGRAPAAARSCLLQALQFCDGVKFAALRAPVEARRRALAAAKAFAEGAA